MKRFSLFFVLLFPLMLSRVPLAAAAPYLLENTKHDLSSNSTASIRSTFGAGTQEICVFCHTPHSAHSDAPLWNRTDVAGGYTPYTSDVLSTIGLLPEDPASKAATGYNAHVKTRICLSCHDGTIALGNLVNLPNGAASSLSMEGTGVDATGKLTSAAAGYLGLDLRDDHPVAAKHLSGSGPGQDRELAAAIPGNRVKLYTTAAAKTSDGTIGAYVECTSCHDPHDNQWGNFLVESNLASALCIRCHQKETGAGVSAHDNSAASYNPDAQGTIGTSVGQVQCMNCHYSHRAGATGAAAPFTENAASGKYLLSFQEDNSCFNNTNRWNKTVTACHGSGSTATNAGGRSLNIQYQMTKSAGTSAHSVSRSGAYSGKHGTMEQISPGFGNIAAANHVVCADCHNPHTAGSGALHARGTNAIASSNSLYGVGGVQFTGSPGWVAPGAGNYTAFEPLGATNSTSVPLNYYEYQVCLKCHSSFAWSPNPTGPAISDLPGITNMTDQGKEFNTGNTAYHSVMGTKNAGSYSPPAASWVAPWSATSLMYCSDCHGNNTTVAEPQGPHGSTNRGLLVKPFTDSYDSTKTAPQPQGELCSQCHSEAVYNNAAPSVTDSANNGTGFLSVAGYNLHNAHKFRAANSGLSTYSYRCVNCHVRIPHGYTRRGMIVVNSDAGASGDASIYATGGAAGAKITSFSQPALQSYATTTAVSPFGCNTVAGCHHNP